jgi:integrase
MAGKVSHPTVSKIKDALSSILRAAVDVDYLIENPMEGLRLPQDKRARQPKPTVTPAQFHELIKLVSEPYATMLYVSVWTGLRVGELIGLKWRCVHADCVTVEERFSRGDWSVPKTQAILAGGLGRSRLARAGRSCRLWPVGTIARRCQPSPGG